MVNPLFKISGKVDWLNRNQSSLSQKDNFTDRHLAIFFTLLPLITVHFATIGRKMNGQYGLVKDKPSYVKSTKCSQRNINQARRIDITPTATVLKN